MSQHPKVRATFCSAATATQQNPQQGTTTLLRSHICMDDVNSLELIINPCRLVVIRSQSAVFVVPLCSLSSDVDVLRLSQIHGNQMRSSSFYLLCVFVTSLIPCVAALWG